MFNFPIPAASNDKAAENATMRQGQLLANWLLITFDLLDQLNELSVEGVRQETADKLASLNAVQKSVEAALGLKNAVAASGNNGSVAPTQATPDAPAKVDAAPQTFHAGNLPEVGDSVMCDGRIYKGIGEVESVITAPGQRDYKPGRPLPQVIVRRDDTGKIIRYSGDEDVRRISPLAPVGAGPR